MSEIVPILQGLSAPLLLLIIVGGYRALTTLHDIDKRVAIIEHHLEMKKESV